MRVTQNMLTSSSLRNLTDSYKKMGKYQDQLSTGKKINRPSDDPVVAMKGMFYRSNLREVEQFKRNLSELYLWMENSEAGIEQASNAIHRVRELVVQGSNGTLSKQEKQAIAAEIGQLKDDVVSVANTKVAGRYIYNGSAVDKAPVDGSTNPPTAILNTNDYTVEISRGVSLKANVNPDNIFSQNLFKDLQDVVDTLNSDGDVSNILNKLDVHMDKLQAERSDLGARYNRLEMVDRRIAQQEIMATRVLSDNEDIDMERVITDLKSQESVHRAALAAGARIIQPTLLDFLR
ncbi:flagellar hook-associated protein FlgL [Bacillus sp. HMF5848]|uniref:flagellar hook-associated protein FlgL n=1 Tax=Bacillus sp. HMF5848 TaxID=2495421 RepID=UPI000F7A64B2|nr:flagellar hook-associated protein FlgL [Bacillus sp. HMF5848]RSK28623.1 flagellar hook-associated protein FlgL [Bacillus sp. HMF5848]